MSSWSESLGGYIQLELPERDHHWLDKAYKFNSARSAFASLVDQLAIQSIWMPRYICDTMANYFNDRGIKVYFYDLAEDFTILSEIRLDENSVLLYVNYFGICLMQAQKVIAMYGANKVVIDNSQALFCDPLETLATIYSPRKFFGLPDGGLLYSEEPSIKQPENRDNSSETRMTHLIRRLTESPECGFQHYLEAEHAISKLPIQGMSLLTERLIYAVDYEASKIKRTKNFRYLHRYLGQYNQLDFNIDDLTAPLCYPLLGRKETASRSELIDNRVFIPSYWPEVLNRVDEASFEWNLVSNGLFLPCDQRYNEDDLDRLITLLAIK